MAKNDFTKEKEQILHAIEELKKRSSKDALQLIKIIYKETYKEQGIYSTAFFLIHL